MTRSCRLTWRALKSGERRADTAFWRPKDPIEISVDNYEEQLRENFVLVRAAERRARIEAGLGPRCTARDELLKTLVVSDGVSDADSRIFDPHIWNCRKRFCRP